MGYYIRVLATDDRPIPEHEISESLPRLPSIELVVDANDDAGWAQLVLRHAGGSEIASIEKNLVLPGQLGEEEIAEFIGNVRGEKPDSAARWLENYLPGVRTIYALELLNGTDVENGWAAVHAVQTCIWTKRGGILQADGEGFSNEDGYSILWQFPDHVKGDWSMAVLDSSGNWTRFSMNLGNHDHRSAFLAGRVPAGVKLL